MGDRLRSPRIPLFGQKPVIPLGNGGSSTKMGDCLGSPRIPFLAHPNLFGTKGLEEEDLGTLFVMDGYSILRAPVDTFLFISFMNFLTYSVRWFFQYYYFVRLMGRKASHVALECALQSHPNMVILGEEVSASKLTLFDITKQICDAVQARAEEDKNHGVILLPEGLIENIPEIYALLQEIHSLQRQGVSIDNISSQLSPWASALFEFLPIFIKKQLLLHPESDDSAQLSQIETEKLLAHLVEAEMAKRTKEATYTGKKFNAICHFFGYQARGSLPSKFDCDYAYVLGHICYHILAAGLNGYMATITNLKSPSNKWRCGAAPISAMMTVKRWARGPGRSNIGKPAVHPATVDLNGKAYGLLRGNASSFLLEDMYRNPGPIQYDGPGADSKTMTLCVEDQDYMGRIKKLQEYLDKVRNMVKPGCSQDVLKAALCSMSSVTDVLTVMSTSSYSGSAPL